MSVTVAGWVVVAIAALMLFVLWSLDRSTKALDRDMRNLLADVRAVLALVDDEDDGDRRGSHRAAA